MANGRVNVTTSACPGTFRYRHRLAAAPARSPGDRRRAQLDDVGAFSSQLAGVGHRGAGVEVAAAIGERVLSDVDDLNEAGVSRRKQRTVRRGSGNRAAHAVRRGRPPRWSAVRRGRWRCGRGSRRVRFPGRGRRIRWVRARPRPGSVQAVGERHVAGLELPAQGPGWCLLAAELAEQVGAGDESGEPAHDRVVDGQRRAGDDGEGQAVGHGFLPGFWPGTVRDYRASASMMVVRIATRGRSAGVMRRGGRG